VDSQSIWSFYFSKEAFLVAEAVISAQQLVSLHLGDEICLGGELFDIITLAIYCCHYDLLGGVYDVPHAMLCQLGLLASSDEIFWLLLLCSHGGDCVWLPHVGVGLRGLDPGS